VLQKYYIILAAAGKARLDAERAVKEDKNRAAQRWES